jgi:tetratricopeptide (TPR) repeat protein
MILLLFGLTGITGLLIAAETKQPTKRDEVGPPNPSTAKWHIERGAAHYNKQDWEKAITAFSEAIRANPMDPLAYDWRAAAYCARGDWNKAISDFSQSLHLTPTNARVYLSRGIAYRETHEIEKAISDFNECLRINPKDVMALGSRGVAFRENNQFERAMVDYREAMRLDPTNALVYNAIAWLRATCPVAAMRDGKHAVELATKACDLSDWTQWRCIDTLAAAFAEIGDFKQAVEYQKQAIEMNGVLDNERNEMRRRLSLYEQQQPYREKKRE